MTKSIAKGESSFSDLVGDGSYYVDKTESFIQLFDKESKTKVQLFTRPRRFGKSLYLSTLKSFLEMNYNDQCDCSYQEKLFEGLAVTKHHEFCEKFMGKFPVISISLRYAYSLESFNSSVFCLAQSISETANQMDYLDKFSLSIGERNFLNLVRHPEENKNLNENVILYLDFLCQLVVKYIGKKPIVLIDEYDVPLQKTFHKDYYVEFKDKLAAVLGKALKDSTNVYKSIITGCLRIAKESIFTGFNNFDVNSLSSLSYGETFGFTAIEVESLLNYYQLNSYKDVFKRWYDGYRIAEKEIYCPWDVLSYILDLKANIKATPLSYWSHTGDYGFLKELFEIQPLVFENDFAKLLNHEEISINLKEDLSYQEISSINDPNFFWTLLFHCGYLTLVHNYVQGKESTLRIPNESIFGCFLELSKWYMSTKNNNFNYVSSYLVKSLYDADTSGIEKSINNLLANYSSFCDCSKNSDKESYYHAFMNGCFSSCLNINDYEYASNIELGKGRADICFYNRNIENSNGLGIILEIKLLKSENETDKTIEDGLNQIINSEYAQGLLERRFDLNKVNCFCLAFLGKKVKVGFKEFKP